MGWIYIFFNLVNFKVYIGKWCDSKVETRRDQHRFGKGAGYSKHLHNAIQKHGWDNFIFDTLHYAPKEMLADLEKQEITRFDCNSNQGGWGYNKTSGGDGWTSKDSSEIQRKRIADGTHHFLDSEFQSETNRKRVADGTHNFLGPETNRKRVADGTHHFLDGEISRKAQRRRIKDGTHHFLDSEFQGEVQRKRVADGTHHFLGDNNPVHKRIEDGTHHFLRDNDPRARPEYMQVYWEFVLMFPLGVKEVRKRLLEKFKDIPKTTIYRWIRKWQNDLEHQ